MNLHFISFGGKNFELSQKRIVRQIKKSKLFDSIIFYSDSDLPDEFKEKYINCYSKSQGYGYYIWKPYIIRKRLKEINEGDALLYLDAGCHFNNKGKLMFKTMVEVLDKLEMPIIANQITHGKYSDIAYSKMDIIEYFGLDINNDLLKRGQFQSGQILMMKNSASMHLIEEWNKVYEYDHQLFNDVTFKNLNQQGFVSHRHDQSAFSILCKILGVYGYPEYLTFKPNLSKEENILRLSFSPFLTLRDRGIIEKKWWHKII